MNNEEAVIKRLKQVYNQSLKDITQKAQELQMQIVGLQEALETVEDAAERKRMKSMIQSKVYQKQYQDALKKQISSILDNLHVEEFKSVSAYLQKCYEDGFVGTLYDLQGQGIPLLFPLNQEAMVKAVQLDSKISEGLYTRLGKDVALLKNKITAQVSRGIATGMSCQQVAQQLAGHTRIGYNNAVRISRTEGHRIQNQSAMDACYKAKDKGADVVKQWDSTLDGKTRPSHQQVDGEIRELDEKFSNGLMFPGDPSGGAAEVVNCRCALLQRARWALDEDELETLKERAAYFGLDKTDNFEDYKKKYLNAVEQERIAKSRSFVVDSKIIDSRAYADKFDHMTSDKQERREYLKAAKEMLHHRSGQNGEDLYLYNKASKAWTKSTVGKQAGTPEYTDGIKDAIKKAKPGELVAFHNHPASMPPSVGDLNAALHNGYYAGYVLCHDGTIFAYTAPKQYIDSEIYKIRIENFKRNGYNEFAAQKNTIEYLSNVYDFVFEEVK